MPPPLLGSEEAGQGSVNTAAGQPPQGSAGGPFPGFGGPPPAVATNSSTGVAATASHSDHTHALDLVTYSPSLAGMQHSGVIQQTFGATAAPSVLTMAVAQIPFGLASGLLSQDSNLNWDNAGKTLLVGGLATDPFGGLSRGYFGANTNGLSLTVVLANRNNGASATTNLAFLAGSTDGSVGASSLITLNSAANAAAGLLGGAQTMSIQHQPSAGVAANLVIANHSNTAGSDIVFTTGNGNTERFRFKQTGDIQLSAGLTAAGAVAVTIPNAPAGVAATPAEYWKVLGTGGATRYIPLLG